MLHKYLFPSIKYVVIVCSLVTASAKADEASIKLLNRGLYYPLGRNLEFPISSTFVTNVDIKVSKCHVNNLNAYRLESRDMVSRMKTVFTKRYELAPPYDSSVNRMLPLGCLMDKCEPGFYKLELDTGLSVKHGSWWSWYQSVKDDCIFALTDMGIAAKISPSHESPKVLAMVHSLSSGKPVKGATVYLLSHANQMIAKAETDVRGLVNIDLPASYRHDEDAIHGIMATKGKDISYIQLDSDVLVEGRNDWTQDSLNEVRAFLFAERDICRPGESFDTGMFLRTSPLGGMKALPNAPVDLELWDAGDNRVELRRVKSDRWGFVSATWAIPVAAKVGDWSVVAKLGKKQIGKFEINISAYVPDRFRVELKSEGVDEPGVRKPPVINGSAVYYFGENVRDAQWKTRTAVNLAPAKEHWKGWTVGTGEVPDISTWECSGDIDDATFTMTYPEDLFKEVMTSKSPVSMYTVASVTPPGARTVSSYLVMRIDPSDRYIGIREGTAKTKDIRAFDIAFLPVIKDAKLEGAESDEIVVKLFRREWKCHAVEHNGSYCMEWREDIEEISNLERRMVPGTLTYQLNSLKAGCYMIKASFKGLETNFDFWHWEGAVSQRGVSLADLYLTADTDVAKPGDKVSLSFSSANVGKAYIVSGERGIEYSECMDVKLGVNKFTVPIRSDAVSRYTYVGVTVMNENAPNARRLFGLAKIKVAHDDRKYPIAVTMPDVVRPGETVNVQIKTDGIGAVRLMAVDEGVLSLTNYSTPDIFSDCYNFDFGTPFGVYDIYSSIYPELKILPNGQIGGGASKAMMMRKNVRTRKDSILKQKETARVVLPLVEIPASGMVKIPMKMPDFTGSMLVMAVAVDDSRAGSCSRSVIIRDSASLFVNAPRCAIGGDKCKIVTEVFNHDFPDGTSWSLLLDGGTYGGRLAHGACTNITYEVEIPENSTEPVVIKGILKMGGETYRDEATITVRPKNPSLVQMSYSVRKQGDPKPQSTPAEEEWVRIDEDRSEECNNPRLAIASALKWLDEYPYGCLEQTTAAAFPFLLANGLRQLGLVDTAAETNAIVKVKAAYGEIMQMALDDGSFAMWHNNNDTWTDGTLLAMHFIFAAERKGLIKPNPRNKMISWLRRIADGNNPRTRMNRAYATYILSIAGEDKFVNSAKNILASDKVDFATFLASSALIRGGYLADGVVHFRKSIMSHVWEYSAIPVSDCWSRIRIYGMTLAIAAPTLAVSASDVTLPSEITPLVVKLVEALRSDVSAWGTTRDNAWASMGLASFCANFGTDLVFSRRIRRGIPKFLPAIADQVSISRRFPAKVKKGDLIDVEIIIDSSCDISRAVLCDLIPGGFEIEDSKLKTRDGNEEKSNGFDEIRDDRWLWFGSIDKRRKNADPLKLGYRLRATCRGTYAVPALVLEDMYNPDVGGRVAAEGTVIVE